MKELGAMDDFARVSLRARAHVRLMSKRGDSRRLATRLLERERIEPRVRIAIVHHEPRLASHEP
jgi:hypothetical protein